MQIYVGGRFCWLPHTPLKKKKKKKKKNPPKYVDILVVQEKLKKSNMANPHLILLPLFHLII
jgi:hypothetical protein